MMEDCNLYRWRLCNIYIYIYVQTSISVVPPNQTLYVHIAVSGHSLLRGSGHYGERNLNFFSFVHALSWADTPCKVIDSQQ